MSRSQISEQQAKARLQTLTLEELKLLLERKKSQPTGLEEKELELLEELAILEERQNTKERLSKEELLILKRLNRLSKNGDLRLKRINIFEQK